LVKIKYLRFFFDIYIILASCSLGAAQASIQKTGEYLKVRKQFGKTLEKFQVKNLKIICKKNSYLFIFLQAFTI
jgi:hypothetical protein